MKRFLPLVLYLNHKYHRYHRYELVSLPTSPTSPPSSPVMPSWIIFLLFCPQHPETPIPRAVVCALVGATALFVTLGLLGAAAYAPFFNSHQDVLDRLNQVSCHLIAYRIEFVSVWNFSIFTFLSMLLLLECLSTVVSFSFTISSLCFTERRSVCTDHVFSFPAHRQSDVHSDCVHHHSLQPHVQSCLFQRSRFFRERNFFSFGQVFLFSFFQVGRILSPLFFPGCSPSLCIRAPVSLKS